MAGSQEWYEANKERSREIARISYYKNRDKILAKRREDREHHTIRNKEWRRKNPERTRLIYRRKNLRDKYGLTIEQWDELAEKQNHKCAICGTPRDMLKNNLAVDHDHSTGEVRGLLCFACNRGIGLLKDSVEVLENAVNYLTRKKVT